MRLLFDTHLVLWIANDSCALPDSARSLVEDPRAEPWFTAASLWEVVIKSMFGRLDFVADARRLRRGLVESGWTELPVSGIHAGATFDLPPIHKDPFDRLILAHASVEGMTLLTADATLARYPGDVRMV